MHFPDPFLPRPRSGDNDSLLDRLRRPYQPKPWTSPGVQPLIWPDPLEPSPKKTPDDLKTLLDKVVKAELPKLPAFEFVENSYRYALALPGYEKAKVEVEIQGEQLHIRATGGGLSGEEKHASQLRLPADANRQDVYVSLHNGVLRVIFGKLSPPAKQVLAIA